jgi:hypothetical protein
MESTLQMLQGYYSLLPDYAKAETRQHESDPDEAKPSTRTTGFALYDEGPQDEICCDSTDWAL